MDLVVHTPLVQSQAPSSAPVILLLGVLSLVFGCGVCCGWCLRSVCRYTGGVRPLLSSPPRVSVKDFPFSPKQDWMRNVVVGFRNRSANLDQYRSRGAIRRLGSPSVGQAFRFVGWAKGASHPSNDACRGDAKGYPGLADSLRSPRERWRPTSYSRAECYGDHPVGVGVARSQASHGADGCRPNGHKRNIHVNTWWSHCWCGGRCARGSGRCASSCSGSDTFGEEGENFLSAGPNRRHGSGDQEPCRVGRLLREPPGNHWCGSSAGGRTNR